MSTDVAGSRADRGTLPVALVTVLALLSFVEPLGTDIYLPAFPRMTGELGTSPAGVQLTLTSFMVGLAIGHLVFGPLSDRFGRRTPLLVGTAVAATAGTACAVAPTLQLLVALRLVHGLAAASGMVIARSIVSDVAQGARAARVYAVLMALLGIAPIVAPLAGGTIIGLSGWRAVFWVLAAATAALLIAVALVVPETLRPADRTPRGAAAGLSGVRSVLANRCFMGYTLAFSLAFGAVFCYIAGSSFLYQDVLGLTIAGNAWAVAGTVLVHSATAMSTAALVRWVSPRRLVHAGLGLMLLASVAFLAVVSADLLSLGVTLALVAVFFVGSGLVMPNATARALDQLPGSLGSGSAVLGTVQNTAAALAAPLVGLAGARVSLPLAGAMSGFALLAVAALALTRSNRTTQETRETAVNSEN